MTIWVTKYALTHGRILRYEGAEDVSTDRARGHHRQVVVPSHKRGRPLRFHGREWHTTPEAALAWAEEMRQRTLASLGRQADRLASLTFEAAP